MSEWFEFNIHNYATMRVARHAPTASLIKDMFAPFLTEGLAHYDLTITDEIEPMHAFVRGEAHGETEFSYTSDSLFIDAMGIQIVNHNGSGWRLNGTREMLVSALPLLDRILAARGVAMLHAATVDYRGYGICMPAWGGTGKTSTMAKLLKIDGMGFMGDDWAFLTEAGQLLGYAKPMFIKPYHRPLYPHLFRKKRKPLVPVAISKPISSLTTLVHPFVTQYPRIARFTRHWSPEHIMVTPSQAFPNARISTSAQMALAIFVERYLGDQITLEEQTPSWMVTRLLGNFHSEVTRHSRQVITALGASGLVPLEQMIGDKAAALAKGMTNIPCYLLRVPKNLSPDQASDTIVEQMYALIQKLGIGNIRAETVVKGESQ